MTIRGKWVGGAANTREENKPRRAGGGALRAGLGHGTERGLLGTLYWRHPHSRMGCTPRTTWASPVRFHTSAEWWGFFLPEFTGKPRAKNK